MQVPLSPALCSAPKKKKVDIAVPKTNQNSIILALYSRVFQYQRIGLTQNFSKAVLKHRNPFASQQVVIGCGC
jgi:hypothetical protein